MKGGAKKHMDCLIHQIEKVMKAQRRLENFVCKPNFLLGFTFNLTDGSALQVYGNIEKKPFQTNCFQIKHIDLENHCIFALPINKDYPNMTVVERITLNARDLCSVEVCKIKLSFSEKHSIEKRAEGKVETTAKRDRSMQRVKNLKRYQHLIPVFPTVDLHFKNGLFQKKNKNNFSLSKENLFKRYKHLIQMVPTAPPINEITNVAIGSEKKNRVYSLNKEKKFKKYIQMTPVYPSFKTHVIDPRNEVVIPKMENDTLLSVKSTIPSKKKRSSKHDYKYMIIPFTQIMNIEEFTD
ncbi:hypothetical protein ACOI1C_08220 [Bacillus sp. DJP31]|uniref:hypothetical protein n=1 Tax=Bacillus sp. DJP31 TaxID=3409789 RepID=UPI003BB76C3A